MVGASAHPAGLSGSNGAGRAAPRLGWIEELEVLRKALTDDEFESAKRHLLAS
jgi:hypothetical protein